MQITLAREMNYLRKEFGLAKAYAVEQWRSTGKASSSVVNSAGIS